ncbi:MAG: LLM class F420-dependent oxidoreductase [Actinomycetota bacterium]
MTLTLGLELPYTETSNREGLIALAQAAEKNGFDSIWASELYSYDAFTTLTHLACHTSSIKLGTNIANIYARTPAMLASTAASLDQLSSGRFILGLGVSGPQVIEGWHGVSYDRPLQRTRETIEICRMIMRGDRLSYVGSMFNVTFGLKLMNKGQRADIPIYVASLGPKNVSMTAELADGWLPTWFSTNHAEDVFGPALEEGFAARTDGRSRESFQIMPLVPVFFGDVQTGIDFGKFVIGFYLGGMGSKKQNFYNQLAQRYGYVKQAERVQDLFLSGDKEGAIKSVPDELVDECCVIGDESRMRERLKAFASVGCTGIVAAPMAPDPVGRIATVQALARANS